MNESQNKKNSIRKYFFIFLFSMALVFSPVQTKPAEAWLEMPGQFLKQALEQIFKQIHGIMMGAIKQTAAQSILSQVNSIVGGSGGSGPLFITNWQDYLIRQPEKKSKKYINDYISQTTSGRSSSSYEGFGSSSGTGGGSKYIRELTKLAKSKTSEAKNPKITYTGDPTKMFEKGSFSDMISYFTGINNPWAYTSDVSGSYQKKLETEQTMAQTRAIAAQGFKDTEKNGKTVTPGALTKDVTANAQDLGNKIIGGSANMPEVITSIVTKSSSQMLEEGISDADSGSSSADGETGTSSVDGETGTSSDNSSIDNISQQSQSESDNTDYSGYDGFNGGESGGGGASRSW